MVRTYRLGGAERERARALIRILSIDMDRVRWLDGHPMTVRVFDDGKCWVEYTGTRRLRQGKTSISVSVGSSPWMSGRGL